MKITLLGAGNVATHLGKALMEAGHEVAEVWSRTEESAQALADTLGCKARTFDAVIGDMVQHSTDNSSSQVPEHTSNPASDCYIISVKDDALETIARTFIPLAPQALWLHTAGSMPMNLLAGKGADHFGVLYPMQTFSKQKEVNFQEVSLFIESHGDISPLKALASSISTHIYELDSAGRKHLHLAAVFACNFANHCFALSAKVLDEVGIPFEVMLPLVDETARKVHKLAPKDAQTGPAIRGDEKVMASHTSIIKDDDMREIYERMSQSIQKL